MTLNLRQSTVVQTFMFGAYLVSGLILNALQAIIYVFVKPISKRVFRVLNSHLIYANWAQIVYLGQSWSGSWCRVWLEDAETAKTFGNEHALVVMNHSYEIDFIYCWLVCDGLGVLPECKTFAKKMIAYVPVMGWNWFFGEMIFLERNWAKDCETLPQKMDTLLSYEDPVLLLMFCEGTRFTPKKHEASMKFAKENNCPILKHHLLPRPKGFAFSAKYLKDKVNYIYDIELCIPKDSPNPPTLTSLLNGKTVNADMYIRRFAVDDLPNGEEELKEYLYNMYKEKDKIAEYYHSNGNTFPEGCVELKFKPRFAPTLIHYAVIGSFALPMVYLTWHVFWASPSIPGMIGITTVFGALYGALWKMIGLTETSKSGSTYGETGVGKTKTN